MECVANIFIHKINKVKLVKKLEYQTCNLIKIIIILDSIIGSNSNFTK
jgi:hypothetical protein